MNATATEQLRYLRRAQRLAEKARGSCSPNPFVGAVLVRDGRIVGEGWTQACGSDHAEIQALRQAGPEARGADLYVTLEPCAHFGRTPPCTQAIIDAGVQRVFAGITDPNPLVSGKGFAALREAGIEVQSGLLESGLKRQLEYHICRMERQRPFVTWKAALSLDGKYAAADGSARWISGELSRRKVHHWRQEMDVVLTGIKTVLCDDPLLTVRLPRPRRHPLRAVLDPDLRLPPQSQIALTARDYPSWLFCSTGRERSPQAAALAALGITIHPVKAENGRLDLADVLAILHRQGFYSVLLECGSELASAFMAQGLVDKCLLFLCPKFIGGGKAILTELALPDLDSAIHLEELIVSRSGGDILVTGYPVFR